MSVSEDGEGNINEILEQIGVPGRYQIHILFWTFVIGVSASWQTVAIPFTQGSLDFRCAESNLTQTATNSTDYGIFNNTCYISIDNTSVECQQFEYDESIHTSTIISTFDLVCSRAVYSTVSTLVYLATSIPGGVFSGWLSDRFGRRTLTIGSLFVIGVIGLVTAFSVNIEMYIVLRCLMSVPTVSVYDSSNTLLSEITSPWKRPHLLIGSVMAWSVGVMTMSPLAYWLTNWTHLQIAISVPNIVLAAVIWWAYDESPHWLYSKGRYNEAQLILDKIARWNKCTEKNHILVTPNSVQLKEKLEGFDSEKKEGDNSEFNEITDNGNGETSGQDSANACVTFGRNPRFILVFFICSLGWFACNLGYYGLLIGIGDLVGDIYVNNLVGGAVEVVSYSLCFLILMGGRKKIYVTFLLIGGLGLVSAAIVSLYLPDIIWLIILLTMVGRLTISSAWQILYVWCLELFPTVARITMLQAALTFGHIGSTIGAVLADLPRLVTDSVFNVNSIGPIVYGSLMIISALTALYLPETNNKPLPVTMKDAAQAAAR